MIIHNSDGTTIEPNFAMANEWLFDIASLCLSDFRDKIPTKGIKRKILLSKDGNTLIYLVHFDRLLSKHLESKPDVILREREIIELLKTWCPVTLTAKEWEVYDRNAAKDNEKLTQRQIAMIHAMRIRNAVILSIEIACKSFQIDMNRMLDIVIGEAMNVGQEIEKIKWLGNVEQFGFLFGQMVTQGYVELPTKNTEGSIAALAALYHQYFEIKATKGVNKGKQTTTENLERAINTASNSLSLKGKNVLKLPPLKDLE